MQRDSALMFTCSLIEYIGRERKLRRADVVKLLGTEVVRRIYQHADVLHSEPIEHVAREFVELSNIPVGDFDNITSCRYSIPDYWTIGEVYQRLIEDVAEGPTIDMLADVYASWLSDAISNYNTDLYYQPRDYLRECYRAGEIL